VTWHRIPPWRTRVTPRSALALLGVILLGFAVGPVFGIEPVAVAVAVVVVMAARALLRRQRKPAATVREINPLFLVFLVFLVFVAALGVVVDAATSHGLQDALATALPRGASLLALPALAAAAAVLANPINNLPATLVLLAALGAHPATGAVAGRPDRRQRPAEPDLHRLAWPACCGEGAA
jgi:arsenical pump membrane protein